MLSRRRVLIGSACTVLARPLHAQTAADGFVVLRASPSGYGGTVPGPLLRARRGDEVRVRVVNGLDEPTAVHWHGVRLPNAMDGREVARGASLDLRFTATDAGTFWYHAAARAQLEAGLYGVLIVDEPTPPMVDRDELMVFAERDDNGERRFTLNGATAPDIVATPNARLRVRFVNATATAVMNARIADLRVVVMALDGEPAEPFTSRDGRIALGPGNRADVFVDATLAPGGAAPILLAGDDGEKPLGRIVCSEAPARTPHGESSPLPANPLPERMNFQRALRVAWPLGRGAPTPARALFSAERGRTVMLALDNRDSAAHVVHVHGHHFRLLDRLDDGWKPYWLDTLVVGARQTARIAFVADNPGRWPIEGRALDGVAAQAGWFQVG